MALFSAPFADPPTFDIQSVQGGDANEIVSRLVAAFAASEQSVVDLKLAGAGSGPQWEAWLVRGDATVLVDAADAQVVAAVAGNPTEALFYLKQRLAAAIGVTATTIYKVEVAGAGDGPTYMAIALFGPTPPQ